MGSYYKLLAEEAAKGDDKSKKELIDAFTLNAVSLQKYEKADEIAKESGMTEEKQSEYVRLALEPMNNMPEMESRVRKIKEHYNIR